MGAVELLTELTEAGFRLTPLPTGILECRPASKLTDDIRAAIRQHKSELLSLLQPSDWNEALADAWMAITLERIGQLHDELAPNCPVDAPEWDRLEAVVSAACAAKNPTALRDALGAYERHARVTFEGWSKRNAP